MTHRGQNNEAWLARWRDGACPVHGGGFIDEPGVGEGFTLVRCHEPECDVRAARWPGADAFHASFGWRAGPESIRLLLAKAGDISADSEAPGKRARTVRTGYPVE